MSKRVIKQAGLIKSKNPSKKGTLMKQQFLLFPLLCMCSILSMDKKQNEDPIHENKPCAVLIKRMTFQDIIHDIQVSEGINNILRRWRDALISQASQAIMLKKKSYEMLSRLPIPSEQRADLMQQKLQDIIKIIADTHQKIDPITSLDPHGHDTFVTVFKNKKEYELYGAIEQGQAVILTE